MVEMLGTLAVMGVLSVGSIWGYTLAMNKHRANEITEEAKMHSVALTAQAFTQGLPEEAILENTTHEFSYKKESELGYSLTVTGIEKGPCQMLQSQGAQWAELILINDGKDCQADNKISFFVNLDLTTEVTNEDRVDTCETDADCGGECGWCSSQKVCVYDDLMCQDASVPYCIKGTCHKCKSQASLE